MFNIPTQVLIRIVTLQSLSLMLIKTSVVLRVEETCVWAANQCCTLNITSVWRVECLSVYLLPLLLSSPSSMRCKVGKQ